MKSEIRNVLMTFGLVIAISIGSSQFYERQSKTASQTEAVLQQEISKVDSQVQLSLIERTKQQLEAGKLAQAKIQTEQQAADEEARAVAAAKTEAEKQAIREAAAKTEAARAAALKKAAIEEAKQQADLLAAQQAAMQRATKLSMAQAAAKMKSRRSRAS